MTAAKATPAHTPGPWDADIGLHGLCIGSGDHPPIAAMLSKGPNPEADAARIVACVNACEAFEDPAEAIRLLGIEAARGAAVDALRAEVELLRKLVDLLADDLHLIELGYVLAEKTTPANLRRAILAAKPDIAAARAALGGQA